MEALVDLQHVSAFRWLISAKGWTISKMMNSIHGSTVEENNRLAEVRPHDLIVSITVSASIDRTSGFILQQLLKNATLVRNS